MFYGIDIRLLILERILLVYTNYIIDALLE